MICISFTFTAVATAAVAVELLLSGSLGCKQEKQTTTKRPMSMDKFTFPHTHSASIHNNDCSCLVPGMVKLRPNNFFVVQLFLGCLFPFPYHCVVNLDPQPVSYHNNIIIYPSAGLGGLGAKSKSIIS